MENKKPNCPEKLYDKVIAKLPHGNEQDFILVISDLGLLLGILLRQSELKRDDYFVFFVSSDENQIKEAIEEYGILPNNVQLLGNSMTNERLFNGMKFDVVVGNPPYQGGKHMDFLSSAFDLLTDDGQLLFVHPSTEFISLKQGTRRKHQKVIDKIKSNIVDLTFCWNLFSDTAALYVPISITNIRKKYENNEKISVTHVDGKHEVFSSINDVNLWGNKPELFSLIKKVYNSKVNVWTHAIHARNGSQWYVEFSGIKGCPFFSIIKKSGIEPIAGSGLAGEIPGQVVCFGFQTRNEAINFINYLQTNFVIRLLSCWKINQNLHRGELAIVPWLDFSRSWNDKELCEYFNLSFEEKELIVNVENDIKGWFDARK